MNVAAQQESLLTLWVIYENPADFPESCFVVRRQMVLTGGKTVVDPTAQSAKTLEEARGLLPPGLYNLGRQPGDEPQIREVWI